LAGTELTVLHGNRWSSPFAWANKGEIAAKLAARLRRGTFVLAMGDDRTDEDMFARLPRGARTIRVGSGSTMARFRVASPAVARGLLAMLAAAEPSRAA
jgi:trehalose 6-phosphate synthase/phosphatase